jgi:hypothetical protein
MTDSVAPGKKRKIAAEERAVPVQIRGPNLALAWARFASSPLGGRRDRPRRHCSHRARNSNPLEKIAARDITAAPLFIVGCRFRWASLPP